MIEMPEAVTIATQLKSELRGKRAVSGSTGTSPHKWVFYLPGREEVEKKLSGRTVSNASSVGRSVRLAMSGGRVLLIDDFGGRILLHKPGGRVPKKCHLLIRFDDDSFLTVAIQGWGFIGLLTERGLREHAKKRPVGLCPTGRGFTFKRFAALFEGGEEKGKEPIKTFFTNGKHVAGIGNGYLQDILFRAGVDPRRKVAEITAGQRKALYEAVKEAMRQGISLGGRECERDLSGKCGEYRPVMDRHANGKPCGVCGTTIVKIQYLGGSCYICPTCQK